MIKAKVQALKVSKETRAALEQLYVSAHLDPQNVHLVEVDRGNGEEITCLVNTNIKVPDVFIINHVGIKPHDALWIIRTWINAETGATLPVRMHFAYTADQRQALSFLWAKHFNIV